MRASSAVLFQRDWWNGGTLVILCARAAWQEILEELLASGVPGDRILRYRERDFAILRFIEP